MATRFFAAFWNLENLFSPEGSCEREDRIVGQVKKDLEGWTVDLYHRKLGQLTKVISLMNKEAGPDLLGVCEVENAHVLSDLVSRMNEVLPERRYDSIHFDSESYRGIDTAFLYDSERICANKDEVFSHRVIRRTGTRDITQATFDLKGAELVALANHWPSRTGGAEKSSGFRAVAGETLAYWHERIREEKGASVAVLAMGDFNDEPHDPSVTVNANATRQRHRVKNSRSARFYNLSWRYLEQSVVDRNGNSRPLYGTLYYDGNANVFDQILVSKGLIKQRAPLRCVEDSAMIEAFPCMVDINTSSGPIRFGLPKGDVAKNVNQEGFSDHFPVSVMLERE